MNFRISRKQSASASAPLSKGGGVATAGIRYLASGLNSMRGFRWRGHTPVVLYKQDGVLGTTVYPLWSEMQWKVRIDLPAGTADTPAAHAVWGSEAIDAAAA